MKTITVTVKKIPANRAKAKQLFTERDEFISDAEAHLIAEALINNRKVTNKTGEK